MKTKIILLILISMLIISCNKKDDNDEPRPPTPSLQIMLGHINNSYEFIPFQGQFTIAVDTIAAYNELAIKFTENGLPDVGDLTTDSLKFEFDINTNSDIEHFRNNINISSSSSWVVTLGTESEIGAYFGLPYKFSSVAIPGNDTIEINNLGDSITLNYVSHHSSLMGNRSSVIIP